MARKRRSSSAAAGRGKKKPITVRQKSARRKNIAVARAAKKKSPKQFKMVRGSHTAERMATVTAAKLKGREGHLKAILKEGGHHASVAGAITGGLRSGRISKVRVGDMGRIVVQGFAKKGSRGALHFRGQGQERGVAKAIRNI